VDDLVTWLRAQIGETKRVALATMTAQSDWGGWSARHSHAAYGFSDVVQTGRVYVVLSEVTPETADHIALNDPATALAQCEAHEALLDAYENAEARRIRLTEAFTRNLRAIAELDPDEERRRYSEVSKANGLASGYGMAVRMAASAHRHRPGYRDEWRP
jgi:hypothetical protein